MRILLLTHSFNSLAQRIYVELAGRGHELSVELDIADAVSLEAARLFRPDLVIAPYLKRAIPEALWREYACLVVHPGPPGDRGSASLDWAILEGEREWGVTVLQANAVMDGGDVWAARTFPMRAERKSSLYRNEVAEAACAAVLEAVEKFSRGGMPVPQSGGRARPAMLQDVRRIDWQRDDTATVLAKIRASDGAPGVLDRIGGRELYLYDAHEEATLRGTEPGALVARRHEAVLRATVDGAVWIGHVRPKDGFKLPATLVLADRLAGIPESDPGVLPPRRAGTWQDVAYEEEGGVGTLHFDFYNGAMSAEQCLRLRDAFLAAARRPTRVIVLAGGRDFWSNGIHLNRIEAAPSPADESWRNIEAMDELCRAILECGTQLTVAALAGNAGAGGVFLALAADRVWARRGVVLNPHYKNMGNLYGSEYWTYSLPRRVGAERARALIEERLPLGAPRAAQMGLIDACFGDDSARFGLEVRERVLALDVDGILQGRIDRRKRDEGAKPLAQYRAEELERLRLNFYGFDPSYHVARHRFVHRVPHAWTPLHLARHRRAAWRRSA
ncbi:MAG TPA: hydrogenase maturation protein [Burkholderiales bacterium]|nr:hydrogenase maturation protein [Burkholderiales bacterium]